MFNKNKTNNWWYKHDVTEKHASSQYDTMKSPENTQKVNEYIMRNIIITDGWNQK
jgi:hypothetical protein